MRTTETVVVPAAPKRVFEFIADLGCYPQWLGLVQHAAPVADGERLAWSVELRAEIGPFARSKQLRMERTTCEPDRLVEFERAEVDGREHARWALRAELSATDPHATLVAMHLAYDGALWTGGLMERALDDEIRRGRDGLARLVGGEPPEPGR